MKGKTIRLKNIPKNLYNIAIQKKHVIAIFDDNTQIYKLSKKIKISKDAVVIICDNFEHAKAVK